MDIEGKLINKMIEKDYLKVPEVCSCGNKKINLNKLNRNKNTKFCFKCTKYICKKIFPLRDNSFFQNLNIIHLKNALKFLNVSLILYLILMKHIIFLNNKTHLNISKRNFSKFYYEIRKLIYEYYVIEYISEEFGKLNGNRYYSVEESLFTYNLNGEKLWVLGLRDNDNKDFKVVVAKNKR